MARAATYERPDYKLQRAVVIATLGFFSLLGLRDVGVGAVHDTRSVYTSLFGNRSTDPAINQIEKMGQPSTRADMIESGKAVPVGDSHDDIFSVAVTDKEGKPQLRLVHIVGNDENAQGIVNHFKPDDPTFNEDVAYIVQQGSGRLGHREAPQLMAGDAVLLPPGSQVPQPVSH